MLPMCTFRNDCATIKGLINKGQQRSIEVRTNVPRHLGICVYLVANNPGNIQELLRIIRRVPNGQRMCRSTGPVDRLSGFTTNQRIIVKTMSAEGFDNTSEAYGSTSATGVLEVSDAAPSSKAASKNVNLEQALADIEEQAGDLVKTTKQVMASFKKIKDAAKVGDLVKLRKLLEEGKE
ncbi:MAG: hypothetical protein OEW26_07225, partial [Nitrospirota bacterium]|nr:hypothetical protein [Nitrospirota bacterium]